MKITQKIYGSFKNSAETPGIFQCKLEISRKLLEFSRKKQKFKIISQDSTESFHVGLTDKNSTTANAFNYFENK